MASCPTPGTSGTAPQETKYPDPTHLARMTQTHTQGSFLISARKLPISKAGPISDMESRLTIPVPEMIFGENLVSIRHANTGWGMRFTAEEALDTVDKTGTGGMLKVEHAEEWTRSRTDNNGGNSEADVKRVVRPFDWSYSCDYRGSELSPESIWTMEANGRGADSDDEGDAAKGAEGEQKEQGGRIRSESHARTGATGKRSKALAPAPDGMEIPLDLLKRRDPILFFEEVVLYESELDDNGVSIFSIKLRVHQKRMLLLARLFMRIDGVVVRVRDTRIYVDFETEEVIREWCSREDKMENLKMNLRMSGLLPDDVTAALRDANKFVDILPIVDREVEYLDLRS